MFSGRKLSFRELLLAIVSFTRKDGSLSSSAKKIGCDPKTAATRAQEIRSAMATEPAQEEFVLGRNRYWHGYRLSTRTWWSDAEKEALRRFAAANARPEEVADTLGRSPSSLIYYAHELKIKLPPEWGGRKPRILKPKKDRTPLLHYPFIAKPRAEHADILEVNNLIPKSIPTDMRSDMCQEIMLALLEGGVTMEELRARRENGRYFIKKFYHDNFEKDGQAVSFDRYDDTRAYDEIAAGRAAREWRENELNEKRLAHDTMRTFYAPTQIDDVFAEQILEYQAVAHLSGETISFGEAKDALYNPCFTKERAVDPYDAAFERSGHNKNIRAFLWREQKGRCCYCKALTRLPEESEPAWLPVATLEHRNPKSMGGPRFDRDNLAMSCHDCNIAKGSLPEAEFISNGRGHQL